MRDKGSELRLTTKKHSPYSIVSFILALVSASLFVIGVIISAYYNSGTDSDIIRIGLIAIISMLANLSGAIFGIIGEFMLNDIRTFSHIGLLIHTILLIANITILTIAY